MDSIKTKINNCKIIYFPKIENRAGNLTPLHSELEIPFKIRRIFYLYDIPGGEDRGAHSHKTCHQLLIAASGSFNVYIDDGKRKKIVTLNRPYKGLHIPPGIWAAEQNFSSGSICLVLASEYYNQNDYIREYKKFLKFKNL